MKKLLLGAALAVALSSPAWADSTQGKWAICDPAHPQNCAAPDSNGNLPVTATVNVTLGTLAPNALTSTATGVTITTAGAFQQVLASSAGRQNCEIQNTSSDVEYVFLGSGVASTAASLVLNPGDIFTCAGALGVATDKVSMTSAALNSATAVVVAQ